LFPGSSSVLDHTPFHISKTLIFEKSADRRSRFRDATTQVRQAADFSKMSVFGPKGKEIELPQPGIELQTPRGPPNNPKKTEKHPTG